MTGADIVFKALEEQGVDTIFGYPGGAVLPIYDELKIQCINQFSAIGDESPNESKFDNILKSRPYHSV